MTALDRPTKGTAAYAKAKNDLKFNIAFTIVGILVFLANYVFNTELKQHMSEAGTAWNVVGILFHLLSIGWLWFIGKYAGGNKIHPGILWLVFLVIALLTSCGFNFGR